MIQQPIPIRRSTLVWSLILSILATLPHIPHLPLAVNLCFFFLVTWRLVGLRIPHLLPGKWILGLLTVAGVALVYTQHHSLLGREAGVSLLTIMLTLKLMEIRRQRDLYVVSFMGYFIIVTQFLFNQSFLLTLYLLGITLGLTSLLVEANRVSPAKNIIEPLKAALIISLQAIPIAALLFILFPRLSQPLWQFGVQGNSGLTGLSERVSPGSISQLIQSPAVAFRVSFDADPPPAQDRYWRGLVLWDTNGFDWYNEQKAESAGQSPELVEPRQPYDYQLELEPHYKQWLFSLDLPAYAPMGSRLTKDHLLITHQPVNRQRTYRLRSYSRYAMPDADRSELERALKLPDNVSRRQLNLVKSWRDKATDARQIVAQALGYFHNQPFVYTLAPPLYRTNPIDQFLFEGREGFCEHFAASFTQLMRIAGLPSRLVIGYQGGEFNPLGDYFIIRQSDAHAWSEVWLEGRGWIRIDPTAAVAPDRIRHALRLDFSGIGAPALFQINGGGLISATLNRFRQILDSANYGWRHWILDYNQRRQFNLFDRIGLRFTHNWEWASLVLSITGFILLLTFGYVTHKGTIKQQPIARSYQNLCRKLARIGLAQRLGEGPLDYAQRVGKLRPDLSAEIQDLFELYIKVRYTERASGQDEVEFHRLVRRFKPGRST